MKELNLNNYNLTELTEADLISLCRLKCFEPSELKELNLNDNKLTNVDFITENTPFINLTELMIGVNSITDINNIKYLVNLEYLNISHLSLDNEEKSVEILKNMKKLKKLYHNYTFKILKFKELKRKLPNLKLLR